MPDLRPRRSVLYMPAANERAIEKAKAIPADALAAAALPALKPNQPIQSMEAPITVKGTLCGVSLALPKPFLFPTMIQATRPAIPALI